MGIIGKRVSKASLKVVFVGAHPDDPQCCCGGTMALYADQGHEVVALFLTCNKTGRIAQAEKSCEILGARPRFASRVQMDSATEINTARYDEFWEIIRDEKPDVLFTQWPIDRHRDHRAVSLLAYDCWLRSDKTFALYYYEAELGLQTQTFRPNHYVDISTVEARKRTACRAHEGFEFWYPFHEQMHWFRGMESGCNFAEAFAQQVQSIAGLINSPFLAGLPQTRAGGGWAEPVLVPDVLRKNSRLLLDIAGGWHFKTDPANGGEEHGWFAATVDESWTPISIDKDWTQQGHNYHGTAWYTVECKIPAFTAKRVLLYFHAVDGMAKVWVNGKFAGGQFREPGLMWDKPWCLDVSRHVRSGKTARMAIKVVKRGAAAGIYKPVELRVD